ncbi:MAG TPA: toll/interleukin-1 receptor domain-containing protein [Candidatus Binataceae bacterium]|nr:toll/interleukin-1 receptor domain-containing protein [Candidatus Binataceae bacterium]
MNSPLISIGQTSAGLKSHTHFLELARLRGADLRGANLQGSQLSLVDFSHAKLTGADLSGSIFIGTNFYRAQLDGANFSDAIIGGTHFTNVNLTQVRGLSTFTHKSSSIIDVDTLFESRDLPEPFLRGCGVPEVLIENLRALAGPMEPIQFDSCFISFSYKDKEFAERLFSRLRDSGVRVWFAPEDVQGGKKLFDQIDRAIQVHDRLLLVLSDDSMRSHWVETELHRALAAEIAEKRRKLFPIRLCEMDALREWVCPDSDGGRDMAREVREYFVPDFSHWKEHDAFEAAFSRLLRDLRDSAERESK